MRGHPDASHRRRIVDGRELHHSPFGGRRRRNVRRASTRSDRWPRPLPGQPHGRARVGRGSTQLVELPLVAIRAARRHFRQEEVGRGGDVHSSRARVMQRGRRAMTPARRSASGRHQSGRPEASARPTPTHRGRHGRGTPRIRPGGPHGGAAQRPRRLGCAGGSTRPGRPADRAGRDARRGSRAHPVRPDAGLAIHLPARRRAGHGGRSGAPALERHLRPILRRRPPVELRCLRDAGAALEFRRQRLRRDASRALRVGCQAPRNQPRGRRARRRL